MITAPGVKNHLPNPPNSSIMSAYWNPAPTTKQPEVPTNRARNVGTKEDELTGVTPTTERARGTRSCQARGENSQSRSCLFSVRERDLREEPEGRKSS